MTSKKRNSLDFAEEEISETEDEMKVESGEEVEPSYVPQENEKALYHALLDKPAFDPRTGKKCSKEVTQKFAEEEISETEDEMKVESGEEVEPSYVPQENEKALYHVLLDKPVFDPRTGKKCSKEYTQKFTEAEWNQFEKHYEGLGYTIKMLWNPKDQI